MSIPQNNRWNGPNHRLPENLCADELVTFSVDSSQLTSVVSALMKTIQSQSQCIETLDREFRSRKSDVDGKLRELESRTSSDFHKLKDALQVVHEDFQNDLLKNDTQIQQLRDSLQLVNESVTADVAKNCASMQILNEDIQRHKEVNRESLQLLNEDLNRQASEIANIRKNCDETVRIVQHELQSFEARIAQQSQVTHSEIAALQSYISQVHSELQAIGGQSGGDIQETRDAIQVLNQEILKLEAGLVSQLKRRDEGDAQLREEVGNLANEMNAIRHYTTQLESDIGGVRNTNEDQINSLRNTVETFALNLEAISNYTTQLDTDLGSLRGALENSLAGMRTNVESISRGMDTQRSSTDTLHRHLDTIAKDLDQSKSNNEILTRDIDNLVMLLGLNRNSIIQANNAGSQIDLIMSTPHMRALVSDIQQSNTAVDRNFQEVADQLRHCVGSLNQKVDKDALQQSQDILVQNISSGDKELRSHIDELRIKVSDRLREMEDLRAARDEEVDRMLAGNHLDLDQSRRDRDQLVKEQNQIRNDLEVVHSQLMEIANQLNHKMDAEMMGAVARHHETLQERFIDIDKALENMNHRLNSQERETVSRDKAYATKSDLQQLENTISDIRNALSGPFFATVERRFPPVPSTPGQNQQSDSNEPERISVTNEEISLRRTLLSRVDNRPHSPTHSAMPATTSLPPHPSPRVHTAPPPFHSPPSSPQRPKPHQPLSAQLLNSRSSLRSNGSLEGTPTTHSSNLLENDNRRDNYFNRRDDSIRGDGGMFGMHRDATLSVPGPRRFVAERTTISLSQTVNPAPPLMSPATQSPLQLRSTTST